MAQRLTVEVEGGRLSGELWPGPPPVLVFLHAGVCDRRSWLGVFKSLEGRATLVSYDRRGHGGSPPSQEPFSHLDDLRRLLSRLELSPAWLVGSSVGGGLAVQAALESPDLVTGLVLLAPAVFGAPDQALDEASQRLADLYYPAMDRRDLDEANRLSAWLWLDGPAQPEGRVGGSARQLLLDMNRVILDNEGAEMAEGTLGDDLDMWSRVAGLSIPVTVSCGQLDLPHIIERSQALAERLAAGRYQALPGTAHLPYLEQPEIVADLVEAAVRPATTG